MSEKTIGAKITLSGEKEYKKALDDIKQAQSQLRSESKLLSTQYKDSQNSLEALQKKNDVLTRQYETSAEKVKICKKAVADYTEQQSKAAARVSQLETDYEKAAKKLEQMKEEYGSSAKEIKKQEKAVEDLGRKLGNAQADYEKTGAKISTWTAALNYATAENIRLDNELKNNEKYMEEARSNIGHVATSIDEYGEAADDATGKTGAFGDTLKANLASEVIIAGVKALTSAIVSASKACIESGEAFEASMSNVKALSGATADELEILTQVARKAGENTVFSASEAADALGYMALAGWKTEEMAAGLEPVLNLAAAANTDLTRTSDIVTDYLTAFGLTAQDAAKFTDQMAYAMANSNTNVEQLGEAYKNCASTAHSMGVSVEEVTAVLATMANAGVKGGEAGTALGTIMTRLATNTKECADTLAGYGVEVYDAYGNMNSLSSILTGMSGIWEDLTDHEQASLAKTVAGVNHYSKLQTIMNGLSQEVKEGGKSFEDYRDALEQCDGTAQDMAATMQDNLKGKLKTLESALESLKISTYDVFDDNLKDGVDAATASIKRLNESVSNGSINVSLNKLSKSLGDFTETALNIGEKALPGLIEGLAWVLDHSGVIVTAVGTVIGAQTAYKVATEAATVAQTIQNAVMMANPAGLMVAGIIALTGAMIALDVATRNQTAALEEEYRNTQKLIDENRELNDSIKNNADERSRLRESNAADTAVASSLVAELKELQSGADGSTDSLTRQKMIVDQLNTIMPELNLSINEQTGELNMSTTAIEKNIDALMRQARLEAAKEDLTRIAKDQYEAEKQLYELNQERIPVAEKYVELSRRAREEAEQNNRVSDETQAAVTYARAALDDLDSQIKETRNSTKELSEEYDRTQQYLEDTEAITTATDALTQYGDAADETGDQISRMTESAIEALDEMYKSVESAVSSQLDIFEEFDQKTAVSKDKLLENMQSQIDGITKWADNMEELGSRGIDKGLLQHLAEMGPAGAAYVSAFTEMTDAELEEASQKFATAMALPDDVTDRIIETYMSAGTNAAKATADGIEAGSEEIQNATSQVTEKLTDALEKNLGTGGEVAESLKEKGEIVSESIAQGISDNDDAVQAVQELSKDITSTADQITQYDWASIGTNLTSSLASSIRDGKSDVVSAITELCTAAVETAKEKLEIHSPSRKFRWLGEMSAEGYNEGLKENLSNAGAVIEATIPKKLNPSATEGDSFANMMSRVSEMSRDSLARAIEGIRIEVNNTIEMDAQLSRLFKLLVKENDKTVTRTKNSRL